MSEIIEKFKICDKIPQNMRQNIKLLHVFDDCIIDKNVLFVTLDDRVYGLGDNSYGCLGLGHSETVHSPQIIPELCHKNVQYFRNGYDFVLAVMAGNNGIYGWGRNHRGQLGLGHVTPDEIGRAHV